MTKLLIVLALAFVMLSPRPCRDLDGARRQCESPTHYKIGYMIRNARR